MKKNITITLIALLLVSFTAIFAVTEDEVEKEELTWQVNLEEAIEIAAKSNKTIFIDFTGSDWCGWCFKLDDEVFEQTEFIKYAKENLVMVKLDFPKSIPQSEETKAYNRSILEKFKVQGFPTIILLDKEGKEINRTGYQRGGALNYVEHLKKLIG